MNKSQVLGSTVRVPILVALLVALSGSLVRATPTMAGSTMETAGAGQMLGEARTRAATPDDVDGKGDLDAPSSTYGADVGRVNNDNIASADSADTDTGDVLSVVTPQPVRAEQPGWLPMAVAVSVTLVAATGGATLAKRHKWV